jgi:site-specific DNA-methyltransferase (adenine-specific)
MAFDLYDHAEVIQAAIDAGVCQVTGLPFDFELKRVWNTPSLDRIDSRRGYTIDNVRVVLFCVNMMAHTWGEDKIIEIADAIRLLRAGQSPAVDRANGGYRLDTNRFYNLDYSKGLAQFDSCSVPLVVTDPPYGIAYHSNRYEDKNPHSPVTNDWNFQIGAFLSEIGRVLVDGGAAYVFSRWDVYPLWYPEIAGTGLKLSNVIVWAKDNHSAGDLVGNFGNKYEVILFLTKGRHKRRGKRLTNVWECPRVSHKTALHPTEKPTDLYAKAIEFSSSPFDLVVDPCCGSGPVGIAKELGRRFVGFDVDPKMVAVSKKRWGMATDADNTVTSFPVTQPARRTEPVVDPSIYVLHPEDVRDAANLWRSFQVTPVDSGGKHDTVTPIASADGHQPIQP